LKNTLLLGQLLYNNWTTPSIPKNKLFCGSKFIPQNKSLYQFCMFACACGHATVS
jgi:hypothetical protein